MKSWTDWGYCRWNGAIGNHGSWLLVLMGISRCGAVERPPSHIQYILGLQWLWPSSCDITGPIRIWGFRRDHFLWRQAIAVRHSTFDGKYNMLSNNLPLYTRGITWNLKICDHSIDLPLRRLGGGIMNGVRALRGYVLIQVWMMVFLVTSGIKDDRYGQWDQVTLSITFSLWANRYDIRLERRELISVHHE